MKATIVTTIISFLIASTSHAVCMKQYSKNMLRNENTSPKVEVQKDHVSASAVNVARKK